MHCTLCTTGVGAVIHPSLPQQPQHVHRHDHKSRVMYWVDETANKQVDHAPADFNRTVTSLITTQSDGLSLLSNDHLYYLLRGRFLLYAYPDHVHQVVQGHGLVSRFYPLVWACSRLPHAAFHTDSFHELPPLVTVSTRQLQCSPSGRVVGSFTKKSHQSGNTRDAIIICQITDNDGEFELENFPMSFW